MILNRDRFAILSNIWGQFRSLSLISPMTPDVGPGDDGFLWIDIGVDGTSETPLWKVWDEAANVWRQIGGGGSGGDGMTEAEHTAIGNASPHHAPVTLDADAGTLLGLSEQALGLDTQAANTVFTGPTSGAADTPAFRALAAADLPTHTHSKLVASDGSPDPALSADAAGVLTAAVSLKLATGATVTEFSTDGTMAGNSDAAVPTEKAVKTYVDNSPESMCAFLVYKSADQLNAVGDSNPIEVLVVFGTELFDVGSNFANNRFTAPATGRYLLVAQVMIGDRVGAAHPTSYLKIVTSNRTYRTYHHWVVWGTITTIAIADMDTADTARVTLFANGTSQTGGVYRGMETRFMGMRVTR